MADGWIVDNPPSRRYPIYTRANVGEVFPEPVAPLSATIGIHESAEPGWRDAWERFGVFDRTEFDPDNTEIIGVFGGYCYLNVSIARIFGVRVPGLTPDDIDRTFFGEQPGVPPYAPSPTDESPEHSARAGETLQWILGTTDLAELREEEELLTRLRADRPDLTALTEAELVARFRGLMRDHFRRLFGTHIFITYAATVPTGIIGQVCAAVGDPTRALTIIGGVGDVESAAPSMAMWELGRQAAGSTSLTTAFEEGVLGLPGRIRTLAEAGDADSERFATGFAELLERFGARGPNEWEMRSPTWETDPELALAAIDRMRLSAPEQSPVTHQADRSAAREEASADLLAKVEGDAETHAQLAAALRVAPLFLAGRERSKTNAIKLVHECRLTMAELGRRMVDAGHLDDPRGYGMLREDELDDFLADPGSWTATVREREATYAVLGALEPPFVFEGDPPPPSTWPARGSRRVEAEVPGAVLHGIGGCAGRVTGRARVMLDPHHPGDLEPGDILVAPITDPSWTPLFVPAGGVVVDVGAPLSHAIIVSRELGIPCVVSVTDGTRRIPDGAMVEVDGDQGTVTML
jgi:rifampicin phosphotransferase